MTRLATTAVLIAISLVLCPAGHAWAQILGGPFTASPPAFSPDGNGVSDTTTVSFALTDTALVFSIVVFAADSITPVDTLIAPGPRNTTGLQSVGWDGQRWDNTPAPDGAYVATLFARSPALIDTTLSIPLFVDTTPPSIQLTGITPDPYVPGLFGHASILNITMVFSGISPLATGRVPDEIQLRITSPNTALVSDDDLDGRISFDPPLLSDTPLSIGADGTYRLMWDAFDQPGLTDGDYTIALSVIDAAGFSTADSLLADFDISGPDIRFDNLVSGRAMQVLPDTLFGWAYDRNGIDSLRVKYAESKSYRPVPSWFMQGDTARFAIVLADSFPTEGAYSITVRATDGLSSLCGGCPGRVTAQQIRFGLDATPPLPPTLDTFAGVWRTDTFPLQGDLPPDTGIGEIIRIFRNGVQVDSLFTLLDDRFARSVGLIPGENVLTSTHVDSAGNESVPSNAVTVRFSDGSGLFATVPFRPGDDFMINLNTPGRSAEIRLYDMTGDLVAIIDSDNATTRYLISWDGRNASSETVRKGPLVAVATVRFDDGSTQYFREVFLLEASP